MEIISLCYFLGYGFEEWHSIGRVNSKQLAVDSLQYWWVFFFWKTILMSYIWNNNSNIIFYIISNQTLNWVQTKIYNTLQEFSEETIYLLTLFILDVSFCLTLIIYWLLIFETLLIYNSLSICLRKQDVYVWRGWWTYNF